MPSSRATSRTATRSRAVTPPPAPCPSTTAVAGRAAGVPSPLVLSALYTWARARPDGVSIESTDGSAAAPAPAVTRQPRSRGARAGLLPLGLVGALRRLVVGESLWRVDIAER